MLTLFYLTKLGPLKSAAESFHIIKWANMAKETKELCNEIEIAYLGIGTI